ncbi:hypothetical protein ACWIUD_01305 [Helicobacter sp. 23-1044]
MPKQSTAFANAVKQPSINQKIDCHEVAQVRLLAMTENKSDSANMRDSANRPKIAESNNFAESAIIFHNF